jgi:hypothetical protein
MTGCVIYENRGKVSDVFKKIISIDMATENRRGQPITLRESSKV